jgi:hypothetical protein
VIIYGTLLQYVLVPLPACGVMGSAILRGIITWYTIAPLLVVVEATNLCMWKTTWRHKDTLDFLDTS